MGEPPLDENETIDYPAFIDEAMRGVVRRALKQVEEFGLPGKHHFFISFSTIHPGVQISPALRERYPEEMTIVLQYQFWDLEVLQSYFTITLSFNNIPEKLIIPYEALTAFADPSIKFGLQFHNRPSPLNLSVGAELGEGAETSFDTALPDVGNASDVAVSAEVISLDAFRKK